MLGAPETATELAARLGEAIGSRPLVFGGGPDPVRSVGVISGGAAKEIAAAAALGLDCFITGEPEEDSPYLARELGVTLIAAGHNATETVGVQAVGERLVREFGVTTEFLGVENPV
jgi:putative NIF3 family GTP cyclohydrolase 1 type 2